jgi:hypothetical protein
MPGGEPRGILLDVARGKAMGGKKREAIVVGGALGLLAVGIVFF